MPSSGGIAMTKSLIERVEAGHVLERAEAEATMEELLSGRVKTPKIVRLLEALNRRPLEVQELAAFARVMRRHATPVFADGEASPANMVDTCGTGGDGANTFNISTAGAPGRRRCARREGRRTPAAPRPPRVGRPRYVRVGT